MGVGSSPWSGEAWGGSGGAGNTDERGVSPDDRKNRRDAKATRSATHLYITARRKEMGPLAHCVSGRRNQLPILVEANTHGDKTNGTTHKQGWETAAHVPSSLVSQSSRVTTTTACVTTVGTLRRRRAATRRLVSRERRYAKPSRRRATPFATGARRKCLRSRSLPQRQCSTHAHSSRRTGRTTPDHTTPLRKRGEDGKSGRGGEGRSHDLAGVWMLPHNGRSRFYSLCIVRWRWYQRPKEERGIFLRARAELKRGRKPVGCVPRRVRTLSRAHARVPSASSHSWSEYYVRVNAS
ncbi:hypothetical protein MRX96_042552 [Rhipicephalus microplus]